MTLLNGVFKYCEHLKNSILLRPQVERHFYVVPPLIQKAGEDMSIAMHIHLFYVAPPIQKAG